MSQALEQTPQGLQEATSPRAGGPASWEPAAVLSWLQTAADTLQLGGGGGGSAGGSDRRVSMNLASPRPEGGGGGAGASSPRGATSGPMLGAARCRKDSSSPGVAIAPGGAAMQSPGGSPRHARSSQQACGHPHGLRPSAVASSWAALEM